MRTHAKPKCRGCQKNPQICLCGRIVPRELEHRLVIYMHPIEVWRASGTALLIKYLYPSAQIVVRGDPQGEALLDSLIQQPGCHPYVLFPEPGAAEAGALAKQGWPEGEFPLFILIDGSWRQARRMRRRLMQVKPIPVYRLDPPRESAYRVRRQTRPGNVCTAEAAALLIGRLRGQDEPDPALQELFEEWIDEILVMRGMIRKVDRMPAKALLPMPPRPPGGNLYTSENEEAESEDDFSGLGI